MSDQATVGQLLVERELRAEIDGLERLLNNAAIERGRLRAEIQRLVVDLIGFRDAAADEIIKLHAENERLHGIESAAKTAADIYEARIERLEAALEPFAKIAADDRLTGAGYDDSDEWFRYDGSVLLVGDFRKASAALAGREGP